MYLEHEKKTLGLLASSPALSMALCNISLIIKLIRGSCSLSNSTGEKGHCSINKCSHTGNGQVSAEFHKVLAGRQTKESNTGWKNTESTTLAYKMALFVFLFWVYLPVFGSAFCCFVFNVSFYLSERIYAPCVQVPSDARRDSRLSWSLSDWCGGHKGTERWSSKSKKHS